MGVRDGAREMEKGLDSGEEKTGKGLKGSV